MITKELFCQVIENLRQQYCFDRKNADEIAEMFGSKTKCNYNNSLLVKSILTLLHVYFPKSDDGFCRIEFYIDFLEFGKGSNEVIEASELYDTLINDLKD